MGQMNSFVSVDYFESLPATPKRNTSILLFTDRFSQRADMFTVTAAGLAADGTTKTLVNQLSTVGAVRNLSSLIIRLHFCSKHRAAVCQLLVITQTATGASSIVRVNYAMAQMMSMGVHERQNDWGV